MSLPSVSPDHRLIGEVAMHYLIEQGHHNILNLVCLRRYIMEWRLHGIREALNAHNLPFDEPRHLLLANVFSAAESERALTEFIAQCPNDQRSIAILAGGDFMALGAMNALQHAGMRVPQDISIMSIDGFNLLALHDIPLTSLHVPRDELGEEASVWHHHCALPATFCCMVRWRLMPPSKDCAPAERQRAVMKRNSKIKTTDAAGQKTLNVA